jgi:hypothetical protein
MKNLPARLFCAALLCTVVFIGMAAAQTGSAGTTVFSFAGLNYDARSIGMAGAAAGMANDIYGAADNPAVLASLQKRQAAICFRPVVLDVGGVLLTYAFPVRQHGIMGISLLGFSEGTLDEINVDKEMTVSPIIPAGAISAFPGQMNSEKTCWPVQA